LRPAVECLANEITWRETEYLLDVCRTTNGAHIEITEHIKNSVRSSVRKCIDFSPTVYG
jgi:hypothetical protein